MPGVLIEKDYGQGIYIKNGTAFRVTYRGNAKDFYITSVYGVEKPAPNMKETLIGPHFNWRSVEPLFKDAKVDEILNDVCEKEGIEDCSNVISILLDPYVLDSGKIEMLNRTCIPKHGIAFYYNMKEYQWSVLFIDI